METSSSQELNLQGFIGVAWLIVLVYYRSEGGRLHAHTGQVVDDEELGRRYGNLVCKLSGIRPIESGRCGS